MADKILGARQQQKRGTASAWATSNPVLAAGEIGFETDTGKTKVGDGTTAWSSLKYTGELFADSEPKLAAPLNAGDNSIYYDEIDNTTTTIDWTKGPCQKKGLTTNTTLTFIAPGGSCRLRLKLVQDYAGNRLLSLPSSVKEPGGVAVVLSTSPYSTDILEFEYDGTNYNLVNAVFGVA